MASIFRTSAALAFLFLCLGANSEAMIPLAADIQKSDGTFALSRATAISCADAAGCAATKAYLSGLLQKTSLPDTGGEGAVMLRHVEGLAPEAYRLQITPKGVEIAATGEAGLFYGTITLWQLASENSTIPAQNITDAPRFSWRGVLLDSVRHFQTVDEVKRFIDAMAIHKLNVLQWHLTDDQGWRIEIKKYPLLTKIAAWRKNSREGRHGGFYTQDQVRDVVAYAAARHITVVPEIEMPGHASAALAAYPKLASIKHPSRKVSGDWGIFPNLYNVDDATFAFLEDVLSEVMTLFPSPYIHVGGDEAPKGQWDASPKIQAQMKALGVPNTKELQGYFTARIGKYLDAHGRRLIGWDEILEGGPPANAAITSWRTPESAIEAAEKGHDVVFSPAPQLYLDYCQIAREGEPTCRGVQSTLKDVYAFDPEPKGALAKHLIGMQANIWTEHLPTMNAVFYAGFPRLAAVAEIAWTPREKHNWPDFLSRLPDQMRRYQALGIRYSDAAFSVNVAAKPAQSGASVTLSNQSGYGVIHYTLDGSAPTPQSPLYSAPFDTKLPATITATTFAEGKPIAPPRSESLTAQSILRRNSYTLELCGNGIPLAQKGHSGAVVMVDVMNPCWFYKGIDLSSVRGFDIAVTHLPFNFQIGDDIKHIPLDAKAAPHGQLEIRLGDCKGEKLAVVPLKANTSHLSVKITPQKGAQDLCFVFARRKVDPVWAIDWVQPLVQE